MKPHYMFESQNQFYPSLGIILGYCENLYPVLIFFMMAGTLEYNQTQLLNSVLCFLTSTSPHDRPISSNFFNTVLHRVVFGWPLFLYLYNVASWE